MPVDVVPDIMALLRALRSEQAAQAISSYVFTQDGSPDPMRPPEPHTLHEEVLQTLPCPDLHPHKLRHTFASIAITSGADVASVSEKLGHSDKAVTLRMYTHADQESIKRASQIFRDALKQDTKKPGRVTCPARFLPPSVIVWFFPPLNLLEGKTKSPKALRL